MSKEDIIKILKEVKGQLREKYKIEEIGLFGSVVREERTRDSDIDLLVDFRDDADIFDLVGLALFLEEKLGHKVDIVPRRALRKEIKESVLNELVSV